MSKTKNERFIYDEKTSSLYAPDGTFLKKVFCPKALHWNQLIVEDERDRWRGCNQCNERVINLDVADVPANIDKRYERWSGFCVHVSANSEKVIFLKDPDAPPLAENSRKNDENLLIIKTARSMEDVNRAVGQGYWPDVRFVEYDEEHLRFKISIGQNPATGRISRSGDYRAVFAKQGYEHSSKDDEAQEYSVLLPFKFYYPYHRQVPIAAYLIPKDLPEGTPVLVEDPIEDIVGTRWNQGDAARARNVRGRIEGRKVVVNKESVRRADVVG